jgi:hypothetical protein
MSVSAARRNPSRGRLYSFVNQGLKTSAVAPAASPTLTQRQSLSGGAQGPDSDQVHDIKKVEEVSHKLDQWERKLPEYTELVGGLADVDPNSEDAQEIGSIILKLNEFCD